MSDARTGSARVLPVGYDLDHFDWAVEEAAAVGDTREGTLKIICEDVGGLELPPALPFAASIEGAAYWRPVHSTESTSARSGSRRISRTCSSPSPAPESRTSVTRRVRIAGRTECRTASTLAGDSTAGHQMAFEPRRTADSSPFAALNLLQAPERRLRQEERPHVPAAPGNRTAHLIGAAAGPRPPPRDRSPPARHPPSVAEYDHSVTVCN